MSIDELINLIIALAVDNYDMKAPQFAKLLKDNIIEIFKQREEAQKAEMEKQAEEALAEKAEEEMKKGEA